MSDDPGHASEPDSRRGSFPTTQWSVVLRAATREDTQAHAALESLCRRYWYPLYTFVRRCGRDHHAAEDATQQFLAQLLATDALQRAQPDRGRFRTFLLSGLRNFLTSDWRRTNAAKRGGADAAGRLRPFDAAEVAPPEPTDPGLSPEQAFDRSWAESMIDQAVLELRAAYDSSGRGAVFDALAPLIWGGNAEEESDFPARAAAIGLNLNSFRVALHRARRRLGERLRAQVAETVAAPADIDAELRHLVGAMRG